MSDDVWASQAMSSGGGHWLTIDEDLRASFAGCPDLTRMGKRLSQMKRSARLKAAEQGASPGPSATVAVSERSYITREPIHLILSYADQPESLSYAGAPAVRWHLSMSQTVGRDRHPVTDAEIAGWIMAGFPAATRVATYTLGTGSALHADIPVHLTD